MGKIGAAFAYEEGEEVFFPKKTLDKHTQWLFQAADTEALDSFIAAFGPLPEDIKVWQKLDQDRLAKLLDKLGPAVLVTHSASGSDGWLVADRRPDFVARHHHDRADGTAVREDTEYRRAGLGVDRDPYYLRPAARNARRGARRRPRNFANSCSARHAGCGRERRGVAAIEVRA